MDILFSDATETVGITQIKQKKALRIVKLKCIILGIRIYSKTKDTHWLSIINTVYDTTMVPISTLQEVFNIININLISLIFLVEIS